jgi:hypothetical protein
MVNHLEESFTKQPVLKKILSGLINKWNRFRIY